MGGRTCSIEGCERTFVARGYCGMHYWRWSTSGDPGPADLINKPAKGLTCQVDGCCKEVKSKGYCSTHYWRWRAHGDPGSAVIWKGKRRGVPCEVAECTRQAEGVGLCRMHYERRRRTGTLAGPNPLKAARGEGGYNGQGYRGHHCERPFSSGASPCNGAVSRPRASQGRDGAPPRWEPIAEHHRQLGAMDSRAALRPACQGPARLGRGDRGPLRTRASPAVARTGRPTARRRSFGGRGDPGAW
jgi:hypothetical protein